MSDLVLLTIHEPDGRVWTHRCGAGPCIIGRDPEICQILVGAEDVSRQHVRLTLAADSVAIEDLGSCAGTAVDGVELERPGVFPFPQILQLGRLRIEVERNDPAAITHRASPEQSPAGLLHNLAERNWQRLSLLYDLPLQLAREPDLTPLCQRILENVLRLIPGATRGAVLVYEPETGKLALRAGVPQNDPPISRTLIRRCALDQDAFAWFLDDAGEVSQSIRRQQIRSGMYVPLVAAGRVYGVISVDNPNRTAPFSPDDLSFLVAVANYAAAALANQILVGEIERNNQTLRHLFANFSPQVRDLLLAKARQGQLKPGGETSHVTILLSDFRGFTRATSEMAPEFVVHMLNDYYSSLSEIIFRHEGTIDKFIGDGILAVFGSPEPDPDQGRHAAACALEMTRSIAEINQRRRRQGLVHCEIAIGLHSGEALHGFIGSADRLEFTVIGDTVNRAARYCDGAKAGQVLVSPEFLKLPGLNAIATSCTVEVKHGETLNAWLLTAVEPAS